jgi:putative transcriptional regulator
MKNRVRELREGRDWTQVDLGNQLNVSRQTIYAIESGLYDPSLPLALAIGKLFGYAVEEIFGDDSGDAGRSGPAKNQSSEMKAKTR